MCVAMNSRITYQTIVPMRTNASRKRRAAGIVLEALIVSLKNANGSLALVTRLELRAITSLE